jgi:excisionase family DNA binding protein
MTINAATRSSTPMSARWPDVLDVHATAAFLTVGADTVYSLFARGEIPARKVGRKWITTKAAVLRWIESSSGDQTLARAISGGDVGALINAMNSGKVRGGRRS